MSGLRASAERGAEEMPDAVGESQASGTTDYDAQHGTAHTAATNMGAECASETQGNQYRNERHRHPPSGWWQQDRQQRGRRAADEAGGRSGRRLPRIGQVLGIDVELGVDMGRKRIAGG